MTTQPDTATQPTSWVQSDDTFAARLALVRHRKGWNIKEAARACGQPSATWRLWEMDGVLPRRHVEVARQIATVAGCDFQWLLLGVRAGQAGASNSKHGLGERVVAVAGQQPIPPPAHPGRQVSQTRPVRQSILTRV